MADISIKYGGNVIAEMSESGKKTLFTSETYCDNDFEISYEKSSAPSGGETNCKIYNLTLAKSSGWILLTALDAEVLEHINDEGFTVSLSKTDGYAYEWYAGSMYIASNTPWGKAGSYPAYGFSGIEASETSSQPHAIYYPPNSKDTSSGLGGKGQFRIDGSNYYFKPADGFIKAGNYRLVFTW